MIVCFEHLIRDAEPVGRPSIYSLTLLLPVIVLCLCKPCIGTRPISVEAACISLRTCISQLHERSGALEASRRQRIRVVKRASPWFHGDLVHARAERGTLVCLCPYVYKEWLCNVSFFVTLASTISVILISLSVCCVSTFFYFCLLHSLQSIQDHCCISILFEKQAPLTLFYIHPHLLQGRRPIDLLFHQPHTHLTKYTHKPIQWHPNSTPLPSSPPSSPSPHPPSPGALLPTHLAQALPSPSATALCLPGQARALHHHSQSQLVVPSQVRLHQHLSASQAALHPPSLARRGLAVVAAVEDPAVGLEAVVLAMVAVVDAQSLSQSQRRPKLPSL